MTMHQIRMNTLIREALAMSGYGLTHMNTCKACQLLAGERVLSAWRRQ